MSDEEIHALADDSIAEDGIVCAAAVFPASRIPPAEAVLVRSKKEVGVPPDTVLHCRILFAGDARRKTLWRCVSPEGIYAMAQNLCEALKPIGLQPIVALIDRALVQPAFPVPGSPAQMPSEKESASWAYGAVATNLVDGHQGKPIRMWLDPDSTRIPWGGKRARADQTRKSFWINLKQGQQPLQIQPQIADRPKPCLLEIADLYAYITVQAHSGRGGQRVERFKHLYKIIDPVRLRFAFPKGPQPWSE